MGGRVKWTYGDRGRKCNTVNKKTRVKAKEVASPNAFTREWSGMGQG